MSEDRIPPFTWDDVDTLWSLREKLDESQYGTLRWAGMLIDLHTVIYKIARHIYQNAGDGLSEIKLAMTAEEAKQQIELDIKLQEAIERGMPWCRLVVLDHQNAKVSMEIVRDGAFLLGWDCALVPVGLFSREDVRLLREYSEWLKKKEEDENKITEYRWMAGLADCIAALLPPEPSDG